MKKLLVLCLCSLLLAMPLAHAEIDLSGLSFDELLALKEQINLALWASEEWQEVTVPAGVYEIGVDIPAGHWTIRPVDGHTAYITWGPKLEEGGTEVDIWTRYSSEQITSPTDSYAKYNNVESASWKLTDGTFIVIENSSVVFTPYAGANLGFK